MRRSRLLPTAFPVTSCFVDPWLEEAEKCVGGDAKRCDL